MIANTIKQVTIIGSGLMGAGIALIFASRDYKVFLYDTQDKQFPVALENIRANLKQMAENGLGRLEDIESALQHICTTTDLKEAVSGTDAVFECAPENMALKQKIFAELDELCPPHVILASNTSVMSISEIASKSVRRDRIVGTHFWNPPYLIPLVEVIKAEDTSQEIFDATYDLLKAVGKHPVKCQKDVPGFIANRLQHALWREAISIVERGIADAATVDECIRFGFGIRLPVLAPLENADMVGTDLTLAIHDYILKHIESSPEPSPLLKQKVAENQLGFKSGQGFYAWDEDEIKASRTRLNQYLLKQVKALQEEN